MGRLFVFMGKSASGKDTLYGELLARYPEIHAVIPYTTDTRGRNGWRSVLFCLRR